jgi:hypothetical protein
MKDPLRTLILEKMTLTYVAAEDRMRLAGIAKDGNAVTLWLTQRLCNQVVRTLTGCLEKLAEARGRLAKDAVLSLQQTAARQNLPALSPVTTGPEATQALVRAIEVRQNGKRFVLAFKFGKAARAEIAFGGPGVYHWLWVLNGRYVKAGWALQSWPDWFEGPGSKSPAGATVLH